MKVDLKESKENSKSKLGWISNKESYQGEDKYGGWNTCKTLMVLEETRAKARMTRALTTWPYSSTWLKARFHPRQCGASKTKTERVFWEKAFAKGARMKDEAIARVCSWKTCYANLLFNVMFCVMVVEFYFHFVIWCIIKSIARHIKLISCVASNVLLILFLLLFSCLKLGLGINFGFPESFSFGSSLSSYVCIPSVLKREV